MPINREQKAKIIESLKDKIGQAGSLVFVNFHGLSVAKTTSLRRSLKERGVGYVVVKKTLLRRALETVSGRVAGEPPALAGEVAIAFGEDSFLPAKGIYEFQSKIKEGIKIIGGIFERQFVSADEMMKIAMIPAREVLYGQLVTLLIWPVRELMVVLAQISKTKS